MKSASALLARHPPKLALVEQMVASVEQCVATGCPNVGCSSQYGAFDQDSGSEMVEEGHCPQRQMQNG